MERNKNKGGNKSKKGGKGTNAPDKIIDKQLLSDLKCEIEIMSNWYNKYSQIVPDLVKMNANHVIENDTIFAELMRRCDAGLADAKLKIQVYGTKDEKSLHDSLEKLLTQPETPAEQKPVEDKNADIISTRSDQNRKCRTELSNDLDTRKPETPETKPEQKPVEDKKADIISMFSDQYRKCRTELSNDLDKVVLEEQKKTEDRRRLRKTEDASQKTEDEDFAEDVSIMYGNLRCRRLVLENEIMEVCGKYWTDLYQKLRGKGWKCVYNTDVHDLAQVMRINKFITFSDDDPTYIYWSYSLVSCKWDHRDNEPVDETKCCKGALPPLNDKPLKSTFEGLNNDYKNVCDEYMKKWKKFNQYVNKKFGDDQEKAYKFKRSLLEKEKELLDKEELKELVEILVANSIRLNGVGEVNCTKDKWNRQLALAVLTMQRGGLLSWMCLPVNFKRVIDNHILDEAKKVLKDAQEGKNNVDLKRAERAVYFAEFELNEGDAPRLLTKDEIAMNEKKRRIFELIVRKTKERKTKESEE